MIAQSYDQLVRMDAFLSTDSDNISEFDELSAIEKRDILLAEATRSCCEYADKKLQLASQSGTTMTSLFLRKDQSGTIRALCSNIGDSRTIMITCGMENHSSTGQPPTQVEAKPADVHLNVSKHSVETSQSDNSVGFSKVMPFSPIRLVAKLSPMSEDHSISLPRERQRITNKEDIIFSHLPLSADHPDSNAIIETKSELVKKYLATVVKQMTLRSPSDALFFTATREFDTSIPCAEEAKKLAEDDIDFDDQAMLQSSGRLNQLKTRRDFEVQVVREESFISHRRGANDVIGPEAVFSRYNISVLMTRSIGDRYGPRCCRGVPDLRAVTIPPNQFARFVLASDGVWDVITSENIRCCALLPKYKNPKTFSDYIAATAVRKRRRLGMRLDDVTVVCVDVNSVEQESIRHVSSKKGFQLIRSHQSLSNLRNVDTSACAPCNIQ